MVKQGHLMHQQASTQNSPNRKHVVYNFMSPWQLGCQGKCFNNEKKDRKKHWSRYTLEKLSVRVRWAKISSVLQQSRIEAMDFQQTNTSTCWKKRINMELSRRIWKCKEDWEVNGYSQNSMETSDETIFVCWDAGCIVKLYVLFIRLNKQWLTNTCLTWTEQNLVTSWRKIWLCHLKYGKLIPIYLLNNIFFTSLALRAASSCCSKDPGWVALIPPGLGCLAVCWNPWVASLLFSCCWARNLRKNVPSGHRI